MKLAIALQLICWFPNSSVEDLCKPASYSVQGRVLKNHTITTATAEQIEDCIMQCMEHPGCHSSNFYRKDRMCELNDKTHASHPEDMREVHLTNYLENTFRPFTCSRDSDCGSNLLCLRSLKCGDCVIHALGMENNDIPNSAITASSSWGNSKHEPWRARLNNVRTSSSTGSWSAASNHVGQWLQIDLGEERVVTKVATQGRPHISQWVRSYKILFSLDGTSWKECKENGSVKVFAANSDSGTIVSHTLTSRFMARYVRFSVISWHNHISMRAELYGCPSVYNNLT